MKSMLRILLVPFVALAFAGAASAQTGSTGSAGPAKSSTPATKSDTTKSSKSTAKTLRVRGELTAADAKAGTAKVKTKDKELSLSTDSQEVKDSLSKVKVGDTVRIAYTDADGKLALKGISKAKLPATKSSSTSTKSSASGDSKPATK